MSGSHGTGYRRGLLLVALAALLWSTGGVATRLLSTDDWTTVFWRSLFAALVLCGFLVTRGRLGALRRLGPAGLAAALLLGIDQSLFVVALNRTNVAHVVIIIAASPLFAALFGWFLLRERVSGRTWLAIAVAGAGIGVMMSNSLGGGTLAGDLIAIALPVTFTLAVVILNRHPTIELIPVIAMSAIVTALIALPLASPATASAGDFVVLGWFGAVEYACGSLLFIAGARRVPAAQAMLVAMVETVLAPIWAWLVVNEHPGAPAVLGGMLVLAAVGVLVAGETRRPRKATP